MIRFALLLMLGPLAAQAQGTAQTKAIECYCTDSTGDRVELGDSICLQVGGRMFTAQCQMSLNVPMWRETHNGCVSSEADLPVDPVAPNVL
jgi:acetyl-CoA carboxylase carboxyltransferase component